jgi:hypothetical protein
MSAMWPIVNYQIFIHCTHECNVTYCELHHYYTLHPWVQCDLSSITKFSHTVPMSMMQPIINFEIITHQACECDATYCKLPNSYTLCLWAWCDLSSISTLLHTMPMTMMWPIINFNIITHHAHDHDVTYHQFQHYYTPCPWAQCDLSYLLYNNLSKLNHCILYSLFPLGGLIWFQVLFITVPPAYYYYLLSSSSQQEI